MDYRKITVSIEDEIAVITLNDPDTLNSFSPDLVEELDEALVKTSASVRAIILTGAGRGFSSGANLSGDKVDQSNTEQDLGSALESHYNPLLLRIRNLSVPIVTAVNGPAAGIGCSYALAGDLIVASESAYFMQAFRGIALVPDGGSSYMLPRMIGRARAMEMMLLGEKIPAMRAAEWGMINAVVREDDLMPKAREYAHKLANGPTRALRAIRDLAWTALDCSLEETLQLERKTQRDMGRSPEFREGVTAFLEKRPANFKDC